jgi:hypothetical protein
VCLPCRLPLKFLSNSPASIPLCDQQTFYLPPRTVIVPSSLLEYLLVEIYTTVWKRYERGGRKERGVNCMTRMRRMRSNHSRKGAQRQSGRYGVKGRRSGRTCTQVQSRRGRTRPVDLLQV